MGSEAVEVIIALRLYNTVCSALRVWRITIHLVIPGYACFCIVFTYNFDNQGLLLVQNFDDIGRLRLIL